MMDLRQSYSNVKEYFRRNTIIEKDNRLGNPECPFIRRWMILWKLTGPSIRLHHWMANDDERACHDHPWWFITLPIKGKYTDISERDEPCTSCWGKKAVWNERRTGTIPCPTCSPFGRPPSGLKTIYQDTKLFVPVFRRHKHRHCVNVHEQGCWTLLLCGPADKEWGFYLNNVYEGVTKFFKTHGHPACSNPFVKE